MQSPPHVRLGPWSRRPLHRYTAPEALRLRILGELEARPPALGLAARMRSLFALPPWPALGAGFAAGAFAGAIALHASFAVSSADSLGREVVSSHVRSLMAEHLSDIASADTETIRSWFRDKLGYSPRVADLSSAGYSLVGGRLDYVADRPVAALVYARAKHVVNVFTCPLQGRESGAVRMARNGFRAVGWSDSSMQYWVVADVDAEELARLASALRRTQPD